MLLSILFYQLTSHQTMQTKVLSFFSNEKTYFYFIFTENFSDDSTVPLAIKQCTANLCRKSKVDNQQKFFQNKYWPFISWKSCKFVGCSSYHLQYSYFIDRISESQVFDTSWYWQSANRWVVTLTIWAEGEEPDQVGIGA